MLCGGVGGARMARGLAGALPESRLTAIVNVGDDEDIHGVRVCADLDTVVSTLGGTEGPHGWGVRGDSFTAMEALAGFGVDTTFRLGDRDLARCLYRTMLLAEGATLSEVTDRLRRSMGVDPTVLPATDERLRTRVRTAAGEWLAFQDYFVVRGHRDEITEVAFEGADSAHPAPGVVAAIGTADVVVIAPSNPVLSIWPILAVEEIRRTVAAHGRVVAVSPLFAGKTLRGPADRVLASHGFPPGNAGIVAAYEGLLTDLVVDVGDIGDVGRLTSNGLAVHALDTRIADARAGTRFGAELLATIVGPDLSDR